MQKNATKVILGGIALAAVIGILVLVINSSQGRSTAMTKVNPNDLAVDPSEIMTLPDGTKYIVDPSRIRRGIARPGNIKDAIPSIDHPTFVSVSAADEWIEDNELVGVIKYKGVKRVYPLQILVWHEIVNDVIAGDPILVTYCPLCGSTIAYERKIPLREGFVEVEFGTSGKLYNSNLVMYDRMTESQWSQIGGLAIGGDLTGMRLQAISMDTVAWRDWKDAHPNSEVLSRDTGYIRNYGRDPYGNYYEDSFLIFSVENEDNRIHPKTIIFGIEIDGVFKAYREDGLIEAGGLIKDEVNGVIVRVERGEDGVVRITNVGSGEEIVKQREMWFAWYAFHPGTLLYGFDSEGNRIK